MIRIIGILAGLFFALGVLWSFVIGAFTAATEGTGEESAEYAFHEHPLDLELSSDGPLGTWDVPQLQRGFKVYQEVCSACHGLQYVAFRDLADLEYTEAEIKAIAAQFQVAGVDPDTGEAVLRAATPTDYIPSPYPNAVAAAAANNNAIPPDLSLITKARHDGSAYVYSLLVGYSAIPEELKEEFPDFSTPPGLYYNRFFPNLNLAMAPPITSDGQVSYEGGSPTIEQMSKDVAAFLTWTAEPTMVERKSVGWPVLGFLLFATILAWLAKKQIWSSIKPARKD